jgi:hypothetical protein
MPLGDQAREYTFIEWLFSNPVSVFFWGLIATLFAMNFL